MTRCQRLSPLPSATPTPTLFTTAKTAKYIIRPLITVPLTHPSSLLIQSLHCSPLPLLPLLPVLRPLPSQALLAWALGSFEAALFIQPARDVLVCGGGRVGERALFSWTKCQGFTSVKAKLCFSFKAFFGALQRHLSQLWHSFSKKCGICEQQLQELTIWAALCFFFL